MLLLRDPLRYRRIHPARSKLRLHHLRELFETIILRWVCEMPRLQKGPHLRRFRGNPHSQPKEDRGAGEQNPSQKTRQNLLSSLPRRGLVWEEEAEKKEKRLGLL